MRTMMSRMQKQMAPAGANGEEEGIPAMAGNRQTRRMQKKRKRKVEEVEQKDLEHKTIKSFIISYYSQNFFFLKPFHSVYFIIYKYKKAIECGG